jgi:hypothetical protein
LIVGLSVLNVWLLRANKTTQWRGANAGSLKEEFKAYGLSVEVMKIVGAVKIVLSILILVSIFYQPLIIVGASGMMLMMLGAMLMHAKIKDPILRSLPAFIFLILSFVLLMMYTI